jgi:hypothetical protein
VWNLRSGRVPEAGIKDYEIFYFDESDLSLRAEARIQQRVEEVLAFQSVAVEVKNHVHLWYEEHFGYPYRPLGKSVPAYRMDRDCSCS